MAAEQDVSATFVAAGLNIARALAHLEWLLLSHVALIYQIFVRAACAVRSRGNHRVLVRVHQTFLDGRVVMGIRLVHVENGLLLRRHGEAEIDLGCNLRGSLVTRSILEGDLFLFVDRDDAAIREHVLGQFTLSDELKIGRRASSAT